MMVRPRPVKCAAIAAPLRSHTYSQYSSIAKPSPTGLYSTLDGIPLIKVPSVTPQTNTPEFPSLRRYLPAWDDAPDHNRRSMAGDENRKCKAINQVIRALLPEGKKQEIAPLLQVEASQHLHYGSTETRRHLFTSGYRRGFFSPALLKNLHQIQGLD